MQKGGTDVEATPTLPQTKGEVRWRFGPFLVWEGQRRIERSGEAVRLGPRSFDLLLELIRHAGDFVSNAELLSTVWAGLVVEEASVRVHVSLIRKSLGEPGDRDECREWISNVPLRGYRFNGRVRRELAGDTPLAPRHARSALASPPSRQGVLLGRASEIDEMVESISRHRLVTVVGPGGIGKTSAAICAAERYRREADVQVGFVDLAPLISPDHVLGTLSRAVGVAADLPDTVDAIVAFLAGQRVLLLVDNCEHVVEVLAETIGTLLSALPDLRVLATSRETLRVLGECVYRLPALPVPESEQTPLANALQTPSVELLVTRAQSAGAAAFRDEDGPFLTRICKQLEGMPLAIELAAARLRTQTPKDLVARLEDHMRLLAIDNRGVVARHKSLGAVLDWSYALLADHEASLLLRLSVFRGRFGMDSAVATADGESDPEADFDALVSLVDKSLVMFEGSEAVAPYRLLDATRAYAASRLEERGDRDLHLQRHAAHMLDLMKSASAELPKLSEQEWGARYAHLLDDVRFALENGLAGKAGLQTSTKLVTASAPLWFHVSQVAEYRDRVEVILHLTEGQAERNLEAEVGLTTALIVALLHADSLNPMLDAACDRAVAGAKAANLRVLELQARWGRCTYDIFRGAYPAALRHSATLLEVAKDAADPAALNLAHRVNAMANHFAGRFGESRRHSGASLRMSNGAGRTRTNMVGVDPVVAAKALLSRTLWIQGEAEAALGTAMEAVARAREAEHAVSLCAALYGACPVALWSDDLVLAQDWIDQMVQEARRRGLVGWLRYADWYRQGIEAMRADDAGTYRLAVSELLHGYDMPRREMLVTFCSDWLDDKLMARVANGEALWCAAEVWRAAGWRRERSGEHGGAEACYRRALDVAREQGAMGWELRAVLSLARHWMGQERIDQAMGLMDETCMRVRPMSGTPVLKQVEALRRQLAAGG